MLKKLSLAALVAMGSMSFANATPLTEAIKNVDLSGMLRIRFYNEKPENGNNWTAWRTNAVFIFKVPVAENINFVFRNSTQTFLKHTESNDGNLILTEDKKYPELFYQKGGLNTIDSTMVNNLLFMNYHKDGLNAIAGKIPVATPITSVDPATPTHGAGAIATYSFGNGFTVAGAFVTAMKNVAGYQLSNNTLVLAGVMPNGSIAFWPVTTLGAKFDNYHYAGNVLNNDTYVLAGIYGNDAIKAQAWYFHVENLIKYDVVASADLDLLKLANMQNDYDVQFHVDYATSKLDDAIDPNADTKNFWNVNVKGTVAGAALRVGYAYSSDDDGVIDLSVDSPLAANQAAVANYYDIANERDCDMIYADGSYHFTPAIKGSLAYAHVDTSDDAAKRSANLASDLDEYTATVDYAYNKKLSFQAYYDYADFDAAGEDNSEVRVQALYKF